MKILVDTNVFLWWNQADARLSRRARIILADPENTLLFSVVSAWEIVLKVRVNKLRLPEQPSVYLPTRVAHYGFEVLPVTMAHAVAAETLPLHHRDPFDHLLIAQAQVEQVPILSSDRELRRYPVKAVW